MINKEQIQIKFLSEVKKNNLIKFYSVAYPSRYKFIYNNWRWIYRTSLFGYEPIIINYKNSIVGHAGMISTSLLHKNKIFEGIWFVDFIILPEFRNKGLGKTLTEQWMRTASHQLTFCNNHSLNIFKQYGWIENKDYFRACAINNPLKWFPIIKYLDNNILNKINFYKFFKKLNSIKKIDPLKLNNNKKILIDAFHAHSNNDFSNQITILRDENWLNWRLFECPFAKEFYFFLKNKSFIITHLFYYQNKKRLNIIYSKCESVSNEVLLYRSITKWSIENDIDLIWLNSKDIILKKYIKNLFPFISKINFACNSDEKIISKSALSNIKDIQAIDGDNDIIFS